jgi:osmotically inducible protein OsmC
VSSKLSLKVPDDVAVDAQVALGPINSGTAYAVAVKLAISLPGLDSIQKKELVEAAHLACPYSNATRGNIDVELVIV